MTDGPRRVLFLCTGNSARSIMAEALLDHLGGGRFEAHSAGSHPKGAVNPLALETLEAMGVPARAPRSKSWDEFARPGEKPMDYVITVCDNAAGEACPVWPGSPAREHWSLPDPVDAAGFRRAFDDLKQRIERFIAEDNRRQHD